MFRDLVPLVLLLLSSSAMGGPHEASVDLRRNDGRVCIATCLKSKSEAVVATAAHCLMNFDDGGVSVNGHSATRVFVPSFERNPGSVSLDGDFALVVLPRMACREGVEMERSRRPVGEHVTVITRGDAHIETVRTYTSGKRQPGDLYLNTTNIYDHKPGSSGSGAFTASGLFVGTLRGCVPESCGFFSVDSRNEVSSSVIDAAVAAGYLQNSQPQTSSSPVIPPAPSQPRYYSCEATCRITYGGRRPDIRDKAVESEVYASSVTDAKRTAQNRLEGYCDEYCSGSLDATGCRLISEPVCR